MKQWIVVPAMLIVLSLLSVTASVEAKMENLPRLSGATLLMGHPPGSLVLTTRDTTLKLQAEGGNGSITPSISTNGNLIASARYADFASTVPRATPLLIVGIYHMIEKRWRDYPSLETQGGSIAISPDGSRLAYITRSTAGTLPHIKFVDLKTEAENMGPETTRIDGHITWSPDGRRIAFDREMEVERSVGGKPTSIFVFDVETGIISKIADGVSPSWSPSGEWIAFYDYQPDRDNAKKDWYLANGNRVSAVHPDGTGHITLVTFNRDESLIVPPVWSPDSKSILVNKPHDYDRGTEDIYLLDIATLKLKKEFRDVIPVYGWIGSK